MLDSYPEDETKRQEIFQKRYEDFGEKVKGFIDVVLKNRPFIPPQIYERSIKIKNSVVGIQSDFELTFKYVQKKEPDWKKLHELGKALDSDLEELNKEIRAYLFEYSR